MYCRHCGAEMNSDAPVCPSCGVSSGSGSTYCANCGAECQPGAVFCSHCGCQFAPEQAQQTYYQDPSQQSYQNQAYPGADPGYQAPGQGYQPPVYPPVGTPLKSKIGLMLPFFFLAMYERDGLPLEKVLKNIIRTRGYPDPR